MVDARTNEYRPDQVSPPGETLRDILDERNLSQSELATRMGRPKKTISEIINGKAAITNETALQLEMVLGIPAGFWSSREQHYREYLARLEEAAELERLHDWAKTFPLREMVKQGLLPSVRDQTEKVRALLKYLGVTRPDQWSDVYEQYAVSFRRSSAFEIDPNALGVWLRAGLLQAQAMPTGQYDRDAFVGALKEARGLTRESPEVFQPRLQEICGNAGVAVVFVPQLPKSRVSGATRWLAPDRALIQLSLRYRTDDHLWFTFFHEAAHILLHGKKLIFLDANRGEGEEEREANKWAADFLIPPPQMVELEMLPTYSKASIRDFAQRIGISPGIVVGRMQHEGLLRRSHRNDLKTRFEWAEGTAS